MKIVKIIVLSIALIVLLFLLLVSTHNSKTMAPSPTHSIPSEPLANAPAPPPAEETPKPKGRGPASIPDPFSTVDRVLERLEIGNIAFNTPNSLNLHDTATIQLMLGFTEIDKLKQMIEAEGEKEGANIRVSERMEARLSGQNFAITAITPEIQAVSRNETTEWKWEVVPNSEGRHYLHLTLSALLSVDGTPTPKALRTFDKVIEVEVTWSQRFIIFFKDNWQWLWATFLLPVAGWLWKRKKRQLIDIK
ncbi:MAG: hypothetical protein WCZ86_13935 [Desulfurivibrionaceae bacterium]|jgi:hypothetical protein